MAKKRQTTGLPKTRQQPEAQPAEETSKSILDNLRGRPLKEYRSRAEREAEIQRLVILGTGAAIAFIVIVLAIALIVDRVVTPARTVATVNGENISVNDFQERIRFERVLGSERLSAGINEGVEEFGLAFEDAANQAVSFEPYSSIWQELNAPDILALRVINDMIDDRIIRQEAAARNITVTQEEIDAQISEIFSFDREALEMMAAEITPEVTETPEPTITPTPLVSPTPSPEPTVTPIAEATAADDTEAAAPVEAIEATPTFTPFPTVAPPPTRTASERLDSFGNTLEDFYRLARRAGYSEAQVNAYFETQALREALSKVVVEADNTEVWVNSRHILVETEEEALDIIDALNAGESFASIARASSTDTGSGANGGELGLAPASNFVEPFADAVREVEIGVITGPVESQFGFHIIQVSAREDREVDEEQAGVNRETAFDEWLTELRNQQETDISNIWPDFVPPNPIPVWNYREP